ncbi:translation initiation factor IF-2-like [Moschus berezovskii]|uniref:translation initiation factor IF-2-like n=1 Tax=Moschus berezovskii TaxID=68408 RepID=UPI002443E8E5|nr:translation initiation factor IF-2-like [Moschus berezovskii]
MGKEFQGEDGHNKDRREGRSRDRPGRKAWPYPGSHGLPGGWGWRLWVLVVAETRAPTTSELRRARLVGARCVRVKETRPDGHAGARAQTARGHPRLASAAEPGTRPPRRTPRALGLAGSGSPSLPQPALPPESRRPPRPWPRRASRLLPGAAAAPAGRGEGARPGPGPPPRAADPHGTGRGRAPPAPRCAPAGDGPLGTCGLSGAGAWRGCDRRPPPGRGGRENGGSGAAFLSHTRSDTGGPDPQRERAGTSEGPTGSRISCCHRRLAGGGSASTSSMCGGEEYSDYYYSLMPLSCFVLRQSELYPPSVKTSTP